MWCGVWAYFPLRFRRLAVAADGWPVASGEESRAKSRPMPIQPWSMNFLAAWKEVITSPFSEDFFIFMCSICFRLNLQISLQAEWQLLVIFSWIPQVALAECVLPTRPLSKRPPDSEPSRWMRRGRHGSCQASDSPLRTAGVLPRLRWPLWRKQSPCRPKRRTLEQS